MKKPKHSDGGLVAAGRGPKKPKHVSESVRYLYRGCGNRNYIGKPRVKVIIHNGTTVYESANNRSAWEKKYAQYIDSINTDIKGYKV